jgi:hypothetical protein
MAHSWEWGLETAYPIPFIPTRLIRVTDRKLAVGFMP